MKDTFEFNINTKTFVGIGKHLEIPQELIKLGHKKVLVFMDEGVQKVPAVVKLMELLESDGMLAGVQLTRGTEEPDYDYLDQVTDEVRNISCDVVLAMGGGSCLDLSKAVSVLLTNPGKGLDYRGFDQVKIPGIPVMAIPTTAGTGSEVTINAVFTNKSEQKKLGINGNHLNAKYAVLDPEFVVTAPEKVAVSAGIDALVHTLESFVTTNANIMTRVFAKEAFRLLFHNLPAIVEDPKNLTKRLNIQLGAYLGAVSLFNSGSGIAGGISYPLGVHYHVPHGIGGGMFAAPVVKYNVENGYYEYAELYDLIEGADLSLSAEEKSKMFVKHLFELNEKLGVPKKLDGFSIDKNEYDNVYESLQCLQGAFDQNPVKLDVKNVNVLIDSFF